MTTPLLQFLILSLLIVLFIFFYSQSSKLSIIQEEEAHHIPGSHSSEFTETEVTSYTDLPWSALYQEASGAWITFATINFVSLEDLQNRPASVSISSLGCICGVSD